MPKFHLRDLSGGYNAEKPRHLIRNSELASLTDARYRDGRWVSREGYTLPFNTAPDARSFIEFAEYIERDGTKHLLGFTTEHVYRLIDPTWSSAVFTAGVNRTNNDKWFHTRLADRSIITNGVDAPQQTDSPDVTNYAPISFDTSTDASGNVGLSISIAKAVATFNNRVLYANITDSVDGVNNLRIAYSNVNVYNRVHTTSWVDIDETGTDILSIAPLGFRRLACYKEDMCSVIIDRGEPFFLQSIFADHVGLIAPKAFCPIPGGHFFVSNSGFYLFSPSSVDPVGDDKIWAEFFNNVNDSSAVALNNIYCFFDGKNSEVYILFPTGASTTPDRMIIWNLQHNNYVVDNFSAESGYYDFRKTKIPKVYFTNGSGIRLQGGSTDNGATITPVADTKSFTILPTEDNPSPPDLLQVTRIETDAEPNGAGGVDISLMTANKGNDTPTVVDTQKITDDTVKFPYAPTQAGWAKYVSFRISGFTSFSELVYWWHDGGDQ